ncbi:MalY/PatB family protein [Falsibacillus albus]|uniref:cysteine-S-conjugate beta-lyase n=1 Tax=Falsibacillus albus TaxID=2478915 RepID=A0A3L7K2C8_9BACI|nr:MalY/PatB family protein [Falsibacillus albus]RLQ96489.1 pyridoxal phosphate-dependent aminotransferase [Falsibacillus albus]
MNFNEQIDRKDTSSVKWDALRNVYGKHDLHPMWVADMDFRPPAAVTEALKERIEHGLFGYTFIPDHAALSIQEWVSKRHKWKIEKEWLLYSPGVVPALGMAISALTNPGDRVLVQSPVYTPFFNLVKENKRELVNCPLVLIDNQYKIDFDKLDSTLQQDVKLFLLCNPHNPGGRVWTKEELVKIAELCKEHDVILISDEIHSDLIHKPNEHIPVASLSEEYHPFTITCIAPSKTFNLAGLQASSMIIPDPELRKKISQLQKQQGFFTLNIFGIIGMEAAYRHGEEWLEELLIYLKGNIQLVKDYIRESLPKLKVMDPEGGYLVWIDCNETGLSDQEIKERLLNKGKLALEPGTKYGLGGEGFIRMNIACPRSMVKEGLNRLKIALEQ